MLPVEPHLVYKVCAAAEWRDAVKTGVYRGSGVDRRDGFVHLSTGAQLDQTLRLHFVGQEDLVVVAFEPGALGDALRWEPSRGGALFPHFHGELPVALALSVRAIDAPGRGLP
jgi:uncharacterized protein (DUF952 family)